MNKKKNQLFHFTDVVYTGILCLFKNFLIGHSHNLYTIYFYTFFNTL